MNIFKCLHLVRAIPGRKRGKRERNRTRMKGLETLEGFPGGSTVKNLPASQETGFNPWVGKIPWRK